MDHTQCNVTFGTQHTSFRKQFAVAPNADSFARETVGFAPSELNDDARFQKPVLLWSGLRFQIVSMSKFGFRFVLKSGAKNQAWA